MRKNIALILALSISSIKFTFADGVTDPQFLSVNFSVVSLKQDLQQSVLTLKKGTSVIGSVNCEEKSCAYSSNSAGKINVKGSSPNVAGSYSLWLNNVKLADFDIGKFANYHSNSIALSIPSANKVQSTKFFLSYGPNYPHPVNSADCVGTRRVVSNSAVYEISTNNYLNCAWDQSKQSSAQVVIEL